MAVGYAERDGDTALDLFITGRPRGEGLGLLREPGAGIGLASRPAIALVGLRWDEPQAVRRDGRHQYEPGEVQPSAPTRTRIHRTQHTYTRTRTPHTAHYT